MGPESLRLSVEGLLTHQILVVGEFSVMRFFGHALNPTPCCWNFSPVFFSVRTDTFFGSLRLNLKEWIKASRYLADLFIEPHDPITRSRHAFVMFVTSRGLNLHLHLRRRGRTEATPSADGIGTFYTARALWDFFRAHGLRLRD